MRKISVLYKAKNYICNLYQPDDEANILAVVPTWRNYVLAVAKVGKAPQVPSAFSQAFCCFYLALADKPGVGVDAFRLDEAGKVEKAVEIKATATTAGRNDIRLYPKVINGRGLLGNGIGLDIDFDVLYWLAFSDSRLSHYNIYQILPNHIISHDETYQPDIRGGRINVSLQLLVQNAGLNPVLSGEL